MPALPIDNSQIVITASRAPEARQHSPASVTVIDARKIEHLGEPLIPALLRLTPSAAPSVSGPAGSLTDVRIRGSEANHTLLFIDGIRANDPAAGDTPRFELLNADIISRIEVVRGPQSALWGSDAIGGVVAVNGVDDPAGSSLAAEAGSFGFVRASASRATSSERGSSAIALGWQRSAGIDSFGASGGDKDGYRNLSARVRATRALSPSLQIGGSALLLSGRTQFDGYDPLTFNRTDTSDNSRNRLAAGRLWIELGSAAGSWSGQASASLLASSNRNFLGSEPLNRTRGNRRLVDAQLQHRFTSGGLRNLLILAAEAEREGFHARGLISGLSTDQDRSRTRLAVTAEWRAESGPITADAAVRRDLFSAFADATSFRGSLIAELGSGFALAGSFAKGIAQPTFFDLYGSFPVIFVGNPALKPERSRGFEASLRYRKGNWDAALTAYRQRLHDEIVDMFDLATFQASTANSIGISRRSGLEAELSWQIGHGLRATANAALLHATQPDPATGIQLRERRRPKHSGSVAIDGTSGRLSYGVSVTYAGSHLDTLEIFPYGEVRINGYWLAGARAAYRVSDGLELFIRGSNLFGSRYQEVAGYHTEGRGLFAGLRLAGKS